MLINYLVSNGAKHSYGLLSDLYENIFDLLTKNNINEKDMGIVSDIKEVRYNGPATIVFWKDGTKTASVCHKDDTYDYEKGLAMCMLKYLLGDGSFNEVFRKYAPTNSNEKNEPTEIKDNNKKIIEDLLTTKKLTENQKNAVKELLNK